MCNCISVSRHTMCRTVKRCFTRGCFSPHSLIFNMYNVVMFLFKDNYWEFTGKQTACLSKTTKLTEAEKQRGTCRYFRPKPQSYRGQSVQHTAGVISLLHVFISSFIELLFRYKNILLMCQMQVTCNTWNNETTTDAGHLWFVETGSRCL